MKIIARFTKADKPRLKCRYNLVSYKFPFAGKHLEESTSKTNHVARGLSDMQL